MKCSRITISAAPLQRLGFAALVWTGCTLLAPADVAAQSDWVRRLDANHNGVIEPSEISDRARPYLQRFAGDYGIDLERPIPISRLEEASRRYYERRRSESSTTSTVSEPTGTVRGFGPEADRAMVPDFGSPQIKYPYTQADLERADETLSRYDANKDGYLDREEIERARWRGDRPEQNDLDRDGRLSRLELAQRYARMRMLERVSSLSLPSAANTTAKSAAVTASERGSSGLRGGDRRSRGADRGSRMLAQSIIERYDLNKNGVLEPREIARAGIDTGKADYDRDGLIDRNELAEYLFQEMESLGNDLSELLPTWFFERDANGDGQIEMSEFTDQWTAEKSAEFASYDTNADGIITPDELLTAKRLVGGNYENPDAMILLPRSVVVSEIQIDEDVVIGDVNAQLSITHTFNEHLDGYLIGPNGTRIELFSGVGGSDDHFDQTIFDDQAPVDIARGRAPFRGNFRPGALAKRQPGLAAFNGQNAKGLWQLMIRSSRSDRSGVLHGWSLIVTPSQDSVDRLQD